MSAIIDLEQLHAGQNNIIDISPLSGLVKLTWLKLNSNQISDISSLSGLTALNELDLQHNNISDISDLEGLIQLTSLNLAYNAIRDIEPLVNNSGMGSGDYVSLIFDPLNHESINTHIPALQNRGVNISWIANTLPPGTVMDLTVDSVLESSVFLSWTAPGEDYAEGIAYRYEIKYATDQSVLTSGTGGTAATDLPTPDTAGTPQAFEVTGLQEDTTYYFALRTQDNSENWSDISNIVSA